MVYLQSVEFSLRDSEQLLQGMEECENATGEASFEAQACDENRTGVRGRRLDLFTCWGCIRSGCADAGRAASAEFFADTPDRAR